MAKDSVLDSSAVLAYFEGEKGCQTVTEILRKSVANSSRLFLSAANWAEILSVIERRHGVAKREQTESLIEQMNLRIVDIDKRLAHLAAYFNVHFKLHYMDAFAAALAMDKKAELVTADKDFKSVEDKIHIAWI